MLSVFLDSCWQSGRRPATGVSRNSLRQMLLTALLRFRREK